MGIVTFGQGETTKEILKKGIFESDKTTISLNGSSFKESTWQDDFLGLLEVALPNWNDYFSIYNSKVENWDARYQLIEKIAMRASDIKIVTLEKIKSSYMFTELGEIVQEAPGKLIFCNLLNEKEDYENEQQKNDLKKAEFDIRSRGGIVVYSIEALVEVVIRRKQMASTPYNLVNKDLKDTAGFEDHMNFSVFFGGSCKAVNGINWQDEAMSQLSHRFIEGFNPVVPNWTEECQVREDAAIDGSEINAFGLNTDSHYSMYELGKIQFTRPDSLVVYLDAREQNLAHLDEEQRKHMVKVLKKIGDDLEKNNITVKRSMDSLIDHVQSLANDHFRRLLFKALAYADKDKFTNLLNFIKEKGVKLTQGDEDILSQVENFA